MVEWRDANGLVPGPPVSPLRVATDPRRVHGKQAIKDFTLKYPDEAPPEELARINTICLVQMDVFVVESLKNAPEVRCAAAGLLCAEGHMPCLRTSPLSLITPPHLLSRLLQGTDINKYMSLLEETAIQEVRSRAWCMLPYPINDLHSNPVRPPPFLA